MPDQLQLRGGTTTEHNSFTGAAREVTVDTTKKTLVVHDGSQAGGTPLMKEAGANNAASVILGSGGVNAFTIDSNQDITLTGASANVVWDKSENAFEFADSAKAVFGTGLDLNIYHNPSGAGTNYIQAISGNTIVQQQGNGAEITIGATNIRLKNHNINETYLYGVNNGAVELYYDNSKKLETTSSGITVSGIINSSTINSTGNIEIDIDNGEFRCGASGDFKISHNGSENILRSDFLTVFRNGANDETLAKLTPNGAVELYYDNGKKFETTSSGNKATGKLALDDGTGSSGNYIALGTSDDLKIYHDGSNNYIEGNNQKTIIRNTSNNIHLQAKSGEGGIDVLPDANVKLYFDGSKKFETSGDGGKITGELDVFKSGTGDVFHVQGNGTGAVVAKIENAYNSDNDRFAILELKSGMGSIRFNSNSDSNEGSITYKMADNTMIFGVNNDSEKLRIQSGGGISFNGDTAADNALDDYEQGTFTPTFYPQSSAMTLNYAYRNGQYTKIGNVVYFQFRMKLSSIGSENANQGLGFNGLPFNPDYSNFATGQISCTVYGEGWTGEIPATITLDQSGTNRGTFRYYNNTTWFQSLASDLNGSNSHTVGSGFYFVA